MLKKQNTTTSSPLAVERAVDELRRQGAIIIRENPGHAIANYPVEFLDEETLSTLRSPSLRLLITGARAKTLGLPPHDLKMEAEHLSLAAIQAICDPLAAQKSLSGQVTQEASPIDSMALQLAKYASLLPALLLIDAREAPPGLLEVSAADVAHYLANPLVDILQTAKATLPIEGAEKTSLVSFRSRHSASVHLALIIGDIDPATPPLTRIHSSCVTGDILGSLRCDCGDQLKMALAEIIAAGSGLLIYLHQEGRGIGITNKLRAYQLQERGYDTYTANLMLGFEEDERDFSIASAILKQLGISRIRLLTNNPQKITALEKSGIVVAERLPLVAKSGAHNHSYLEAKEKKAGHLF